mgnify:CR=1 FL=1
MVKRNNRKNGIVAFLLPLEFTAVYNCIYIYIRYIQVERAKIAIETCQEKKSEKKENQRRN